MNVYLKVVGFIALILIPTLFVLNMCGDAAATAKSEFSASAMLKKYEYFKDLSAAIDKKRADIEVFSSVLNGIDDHKSFDYQQTRSETLGLISSHNGLCSEYNSAMSKFNYAFCNKGSLPASNLTPLPREMKPYISSIN